MESVVGWGYEGHGAEARDGNGQREVEESIMEQRLTRISAEITDIKPVVVVVDYQHASIYELL